ncbi:uncharacterized protein [Diabrotica undecimpunctata]|uniref:uncharacterized protein n=1 Tax=Diabrotica undecimpunctata TaxID=50387 RepID=UPI003B63F201
MASKNQPNRKTTQEVQINIAVKQQKSNSGPSKTQNKAQVKLDVGNAPAKPRKAPQPKANPGFQPILKPDQAVMLQQQMMLQQSLILQQQNILATQQMLASTSVAQIPKNPGRPRVNNASSDKPKPAPKATNSNAKTKQQVKVNVKINNQ